MAYYFVRDQLKCPIQKCVTSAGAYFNKGNLVIYWLDWLFKYSSCDI